MRRRFFSLLGIGLLWLPSSALAQSALDPSQAVPPAIPFSGTIDGAQGTVVVTFAL